MLLKLPCKFIEIALPHPCSLLDLLHILTSPFNKSTPGRLLLQPPRGCLLKMIIAKQYLKFSENRQRKVLLEKHVLFK